MVLPHSPISHKHTISGKLKVCYLQNNCSRVNFFTVNRLPCSFNECHRLSNIRTTCTIGSIDLPPRFLQNRFRAEALAVFLLLYRSIWVSDSKRLQLPRPSILLPKGVTFSPSV